MLASDVIEEGRDVLNYTGQAVLDGARELRSLSRAQRRWALETKCLKREVAASARLKLSIIGYDVDGSDLEANARRGEILMSDLSAGAHAAGLFEIDDRGVEWGDRSSHTYAQALAGTSPPILSTFWTPLTFLPWRHRGRLETNVGPPFTSFTRRGAEALRLYPLPTADLPEWSPTTEIVAAMAVFPDLRITGTAYPAAVAATTDVLPFPDGHLSALSVLWAWMTASTVLADDPVVASRLPALLELYVSEKAQITWNEQGTTAVARMGSEGLTGGRDGLNLPEFWSYGLPTDPP